MIFSGAHLIKSGPVGTKRKEYTDSYRQSKGPDPKLNQGQELAEHQVNPIINDLFFCDLLFFYNLLYLLSIIVFIVTRVIYNLRSHFKHFLET